MFDCITAQEFYTPISIVNIFSGRECRKRVLMHLTYRA